MSPWLLAPTVVVLVGALVRVVSVRGFSGIEGLGKTLVPLALISGAYLMLESYEKRYPTSARFWPGPTHRRWLFVAMVVVTDCYLTAVLVLGRRFMDAVDI
jgi:purine-cytosine permease-like protein